MLFAELAAAVEDVRSESGRLAKVERIAAALRALDASERAAGAMMLAGSLRQRVLGVGWAALREDPPPPADDASLTVSEVDAALQAVAAISGAGSVAARRAALVALMGRATASEQEYLRALVLGGVRQGALVAVVGDAVAKASGQPVKAVRRALMLRGELGAVAEVALAGGGSRSSGSRSGGRSRRCWPRPRPTWPRRSRRPGRRRSSGSSTGHGSRSTALATRSASSRARWMT